LMIGVPSLAPSDKNATNVQMSAPQPTVWAAGQSHMKRPKVCLKNVLGCVFPA
jgi:hypothetical protein